MRVASPKTIVLLIGLVSLSLLSGCTNWEKKYQANLELVAKGRLPDPISRCGTPAGFPRLLAIPDAYEFVRHLALAHINVGMLQFALGRQGEAKESFATAQDLQQSLLAKSVELAELDADVATTRSNLGLLLPLLAAAQLWRGVLSRQVAIGLMHAHGKGVLHCDLKPANVLLDQDDKPRLADFGQ